MNKILLLVAVVILASSIHSDPPQTISPDKDDNTVILDSIISIAKTHSLYANKVNWDSVEHEMHRRLEGDSVEAIIRPVEYLLAQLGDFHGALLMNGRRYNSFYKTDYHYPVSMKVMNAIHAKGSIVAGEMLEKEVAYLRIPHFYVSDPNQVSGYTNMVREKICELKSREPKGWIIDLRLNIGGNMYPMFAGLGELFPEIHLGGDSKDGKAYHSRWYNEDGNFHMWNSPMTDIPLTCNPERVNVNDSLRVVFLTGRYTSSSGEAVASAFKSQKNIRLIGEITSGWSSTTGWFPISDQIIFLPSVAWFMSPDSTLHRDGVEPDLLVVEEFDLEAMTRGTTIGQGIKWITE